MGAVWLLPFDVVDNVNAYTVTIPALPGVPVFADNEADAIECVIERFGYSTAPEGTTCERMTTPKTMRERDWRLTL